MTDNEFLGYFVGGLDIKGHRVSARFGMVDAQSAVKAGVPTSRSYFVLQVDHGEEIPIVFDQAEDLTSRMKKVDATVDRWFLLRGHGKAR